MSWESISIQKAIGAYMSLLPMQTKDIYQED